MIRHWVTFDLDWIYMCVVQVYCTKITDRQLIKLQKDILGKVMPVTKVTKNLIIKKIKKTINE